MATTTQPNMISDSERAALLSASLVNVGRLLALGMSIRFYREHDAADTRIDFTWPDGTVTKTQVIGCSPLFRVPMAEAVNVLLDEVEG